MEHTVSITIGISPEEFFQEMRRIIQEEVKLQCQEQPPSASQWQYTIKELSARFGVSKPTIYEWIKAGYIDPVRIGRRVFFRGKDVDALLERGMKGVK